ncbi:unnamed protein product [Allacma fusca]|uniref:Defensin-like protein n=1 Tax=Allacma fusca TaxID=39272 RepID=A0A8J2PYV0_9HEXA|nr:unnamed protein product [Allacma fusca]
MHITVVGSLIFLTAFNDLATAGLLKEIKGFKKFFRLFVDYDTLWDRLKVCKYSKSDFECNNYCLENSVPNLQPYCGGICQGFCAELCSCIYCPQFIPAHPPINNAAHNTRH